MNDNQKIVTLAMAARKVIDLHDKAAAEIEPGFTCGCKTVCQVLLHALNSTDTNGMTKRIKSARTSR